MKNTRTTRFMPWLASLPMASLLFPVGDAPGATPESGDLDQMVEQLEVTPVGRGKYGYTMAPTKMPMDMRMLMVMVGVTDRLTAMAMVSYVASGIYMVMNMGDGMGNDRQAPMRTNGNGWSRGNNFKLNTLLQRAFGPATGMLRLVYNNWGRIRGSDQNIDALFRWAPSPDVHPHHYGGQQLDALFGLG